MTCACGCLQRPEEGIGASEIGVSGGYEALSVCWELNWHPLEEQQMLSTHELSFQAQTWISPKESGWEAQVLGVTVY